MPHFDFHRATRRTESGAFTVIELLVVIGVIGILIALLLPAVQSARESARRVECQNHLKQLALASQSHLECYRFFPSGGWGWDWTGDPDRGVGPKQTGGWAYASLPFLEQSPLYDLSVGSGTSKPDAVARMVATPLAVFNCPTRRSSMAYVNAFAPFVAFNCGPAERVARSDYAFNCGDTGTDEFFPGPTTLAQGDDPNYAWPYTGNLTGVSFQRSRVSHAEVRDGTSVTYLVGEKYLNPEHYGDGVDPADNEDLYAGYDNDLFRTTHGSRSPMQDTRGYTDTFRFGSAHYAIFNMALCDGSVHAISYTIDPEAHRRLGNRMDRQFVSLDDFR